MRRSTLALAAVLVVSLAATFWLWRDNRRLRGELDDAQVAAAAPAADPAGAEPSDDESGGPTAMAQSFLRGLSRAGDRERPQLPGAPTTRMERRLRWQQRIKDLLGRRPGESDQDYRDRVVPLVELGLARPRAQVADARKAAEEAAKITDDQKKQIDAILDETYGEVMELTNQAVQQGQLSPYERNWTGLLEHAGTLGGVLGSTESRLGQVLSPEQRRIIYDLGFEWGEYIGATTPWEGLDPPPPPKGGDG